MAAWTAALQPLLLGTLLLWTAGLKLLHRNAPALARRSALAPLLGEDRALPAYRLVGGVELLLGAALVLPPAWWPEAVAAAALMVGFLGYLAYARLAAPDSSCGCMGAKQVPVSWRSFVRAAVMLAASLFAVTATTGWWNALTTRPAAGTALLLVEAGVLIACSPELEPTWLLPLRRLRVRLSHPLADRGLRSGQSFEVPLESSLQQLQRSGAYLKVAALLRSDVREHWDSDEWRIICYTAQYGGRATAAVFAVPRLRYAPDAVRVAFVDESTGETLLST